MTAHPSTQPPAPAARTRAGRWSLVVGSGTARFSVRDKLVATVHGTLPLAGGLVVIGAEGGAEQAFVQLSVAGVSTGNRRRDADLRKANFLDAAGHPLLRVESQRAMPNETGWDVRATVSARGTSAPVQLAVARVMETDDEIHLRVTGRLDRRPLGIKAPTFIVGRFVDLDVDVVFRRDRVQD